MNDMWHGQKQYSNILSEFDVLSSQNCPLSDMVNLKISGFFIIKKYKTNNDNIARY